MASVGLLAVVAGEGCRPQAGKRFLGSKSSKGQSGKEFTN